jgi:hypothetical protein
MERRAGQAGPVLGELTLQTAACSEPPAKRQNMTFGLPLNMRANCVRTLAACVWVGAAITFGFSMCAVIPTRSGPKDLVSPLEPSAGGRGGWVGSSGGEAITRLSVLSSGARCPN